MDITSAQVDSRRGPAEWFTGEVWLDEIAAAKPPSRVTALSVHL